jgi:hypothetical protein
MNQHAARTAIIGAPECRHAFAVVLHAPTHRKMLLPTQEQARIASSRGEKHRREFVLLFCCGLTREPINSEDEREIILQLMRCGSE